VAQRWDREVGSPFEHVYSAGARDGEPGPFYHRLGFRKSFAGVWGPASLNFYADVKQSGRELHPSLGQDVHMMGGDLLVDAEGRMALPYYSKNNRDRPSLQTLHAALQAMGTPQPGGAPEGVPASAATPATAAGGGAPLAVAATSGWSQRRTILSCAVVGAACLVVAAAMARRKR